MDTSKYTLTPIQDFLPLPGQRLMDHMLKNRLMESSGLPLHTLLCGIVAYHLAKNLPPEMVDIETLLSLGVVSHATRVTADEGLAGKHADPKINKYMENHSNLDFAYEDAIQEGFPPGIIEGLHNFSVNPKTRSSYFPHETMIKNGVINWTEALYQIASWSVVGGVTTLHARFDDLRTRRSAEVGKLELDFIKEQIQNCGRYVVPEPILQEASNELGIQITSSEISRMIINKESYLDDKRMGEWIFNGYESWADIVRKKYCEMVGVDNFDRFLRTQIDTISDPQMREKINTTFESAIGRKLRDNEFCPTMSGIDLIYKRIGAMKVEATKEKAKIRMERLMGHIDRVIRPFLRSNRD